VDAALHSRLTQAAIVAGKNQTGKNPTPCVKIQKFSNFKIARDFDSNEFFFCRVLGHSGKKKIQQVKR